MEGQSSITQQQELLFHNGNEYFNLDINRYLKLVFAGGSLVFTKEPLSTVFVMRGSDLYLKWEYYNETKPTELSFISWEVFVPGVSWKKMIEENHDGRLLIHSDLPALYSGRVEKKNQATLVIKNVTFEDFSKYRCILNPFQGDVTESSAVNAIVTGMQFIFSYEKYEYMTGLKQYYVTTLWSKQKASLTRPQ